MSCGKANLAALLAAAAALLAACSTVSRMPQSPEQEAAKAAYDSFRKDQFQEAADGYMKAIALASQSNPSAAARFKVSLAEVYREWAIRIAYAKKGESSFEDYSQAIKLCSAAEELDPARKGLYDEMIAKFQAKITLLKYRAIANDEKLIPDYKPLQGKIEIFMTQARAYVLAGEYVEARKHYEKVLAIDPANAEASRELSGVLAKLQQAGAQRAGLERSVGIVEISWKQAEPAQAAVQNSAVWTPPPKSLHDAVIPKLEIRQESLRSAFAKLEAGAGGAFKFSFQGIDPDSKEWPLVNFQAGQIPLDAALSSLCGALGLAYVPGADGKILIFRKL